MYARVTPYKMKPGSKDAAVAIMNTLQSRIMDLPGMVQFINVMAQDGAGYIVALSANEVTSPETAEKIKAIWGGFADLLEAMPTVENYEVVADWKT